MKKAWLISVLTFLFALAYHAPPQQKYGSMNTRLEQLEQVRSSNRRVRGRTVAQWPSFTGTLYIYILGLFRKYWTPILVTPEERAMFMSAILLSQKMNIALNGKQFAYRLEETSGRDVIDSLARTCLSIIENQILGIVGPKGSNEAKTVARFCNRVGLPVFGFSTSDPDLSDRDAYQTFYRMAESDITTAKALLKLFKKYNWTSTNVIYQGDSYGQGGLHALMDVFGSEVKISHTIKYNIFTDQIKDFRQKLEQSPSRIVLLWANSNITMEIIQRAEQEGGILAPLFLWILIATNSSMQLDDPQLTGMLLIRSVIPQVFNRPINWALLNDAINISKTYDPQLYDDDENPIDAYVLYAFDSAWMLILAFIELCRQAPNDCLSLVNTSNCFASRLTNRNKLHNIMKTMSFLGVSGHVQFSENTTDRLMQEGSYFIIENLQSPEANEHELQRVEILKLNDISSNTRRSDMTH